jgi:quinol monooxygenase YgiN
MVIVAGTLVLKEGALEALRPHMRRMIAASRAEPGCLTYSYGVDVEDDNVIRVFEEWESSEALAAHFETPHLKAWRPALAEIGIAGRDIKAWEAGSSRAV